MLDLKVIGNRIKELRKEKGLTQKQLAVSLFVSFQAVSNWERGITPPELESVVSMAKIFGVLVDDLLSPEKEPAFLGIDGGGTKTEFTAVTSGGHVLKRLTYGGCNPNDVGYERLSEIILDGIAEMLYTVPSIRSVFAGIAGISASDRITRLSSDIKRRFPKLHVEVKTDSFNLFAMEPRAEISVISGTGSVVFVKKGEEFIRIGGWGQLFDTAGSAYDIGRDAIRTALSEEDGLKPYSKISKNLLRRLGTETVWSSIGEIYKKGKPFVASLAETVFEAYKDGDEGATNIINENAKRLAELLNTAVRLYGACPVAVASGGIFEHYPDVMLPLIKAHTDTELIITGVAPVYGACRRACETVGQSISEDFYVNFKNSYAREGN